MRTTNTDNWLSTIGVFALVMLLSGAQPSAALGAESGQQAIEELIGQLVVAVNMRDYQAFRSGLIDEWSYFTSAGRQLDFESWKAGVSQYTELELEVSDTLSRLSEDGKLAWSTFRARIQGEVGGETDDRKLLFTAIFEKTDQGWKLRHQQATEAAKLPSQGRFQ